MTHGVSISRAVRIARRAADACTGTAVVGDDGRLETEIAIDVARSGLREGVAQEALAILYRGGTVAPDSDPVPMQTDDGRRAVALPLAVRPRKGQQTASLRIDVRLPGHEGEAVDVVVERVRPSLAPLFIVLALAMLAGLAILLNGWGDPSARSGHYEGKTTEEIQADLDADVAWHSMEISVAGRVAMAEGSTFCELRVENVEANHCDQKVRVWEAGHEEDVLFESGAIAPGEYIQHVELAHPLPVGTHTLTVQFQGYERQPSLLSDEGVPLGHDTFGASCAAEVELEVVPASE